MMSEEGGKRLASVERVLPDEVLATFISLGRQLAVQMARDSFKAIVDMPGSNLSNLDVITNKTLLQMKNAARDALVSKGGNPHGEQWLKVWSAMESSYRRETASLLAAYEGRKGRLLQ